MAVGLKTRIIYKEPSASPTPGAYWEGEYKLLIRAKSITRPLGSQNIV